VRVVKGGGKLQQVFCQEMTKLSHFVFLLSSVAADFWDFDGIKVRMTQFSLFCANVGFCTLCLRSSNMQNPSSSAECPCMRRKTGRPRCFLTFNRHDESLLVVALGVLSPKIEYPGDENPWISVEGILN